MTTLADQNAWLVGALHYYAPYEKTINMSYVSIVYAAKGSLSMSFAKMAILLYGARSARKTGI